MIPTITVHHLLNNKPWVMKDIKASLIRKKVALKSEENEKMKKVQIELRKKIKEGKEYYRRRLEKKLQQKNIRDVWSGMRPITGDGKETWMRPIF